jgi:hypothetical protein
MGVNMGYQPGPRETTIKKYAYFPVQTTSKRWVWLGEFYEIQTYYDYNGNTPKKLLFWKHVLTKQEYTMWLLANDMPESGSGKISKQ